MANYKVKGRPSVEKQIGKIDSQKTRETIRQKIQQLATNPHSAPGCVKIKDKSFPKNSHRIKQDKYRIIFTINKKDLVVDIVGVLKRSKAYKSF